jgi:hypothetical protein
MTRFRVAAVMLTLAVFLFPMTRFRVAAVILTRAVFLIPMTRLLVATVMIALGVLCFTMTRLLVATVMIALDVLCFPMARFLVATVVIALSMLFFTVTRFLVATAMVTLTVLLFSMTRFLVTTVMITPTTFLVSSRTRPLAPFRHLTQSRPTRSVPASTPTGISPPLKTTHHLAPVVFCFCQAVASLITGLLPAFPQAPHLLDPSANPPHPLLAIRPLFRTTLVLKSEYARCWLMNRHERQAKQNDHTVSSHHLYSEKGDGGNRSPPHILYPPRSFPGRCSFHTIKPLPSSDHIIVSGRTYFPERPSLCGIVLKTSSRPGRTLPPAESSRYQVRW